MSYLFDKHLLADPQDQAHKSENIYSQIQFKDTYEYKIVTKMHMNLELA